MTAHVFPEQPMSLTVDQALQQAIAHHQAGQLQDAERLYRAILQTQPNHPDANHNLGVLAVQVKQPAAGLPHFKAALEANQDQGQFWLSYMDALIQTGQADAARQVLEQGRQRGLQGVEAEALAERLEGGVQVAAQSNAGNQQAHHEQPVVPSALQPGKKPPKTKHADKAAKKPFSIQGKTPSAKEINTLLALFTKGQYTEAAPLHSR